MAYKNPAVKESLACRAVLWLFDIAILVSGLLPMAEKEAVYQETAMRMLCHMSFAPDPDGSAAG